MTQATRRGLPPLGLALLAACAQDQRADRGIGGTGGIADRGIGGTGIGGVGLVGTVTALGSIWVNGLRLEFPAAPRVTLEGEPARPGDIQPGHVVAARAVADAPGRNLALTVDLRITVAGPVQGREGEHVLVLGQRCAVAGLPPGAGLLEPGRWVAVSGLRRPDGTIAATRVDAWPEARGWLLRGEWAGQGANTTLAGLPLEPPPGMAPPPAGATLRATGRLGAGGLVAQSLVPAPANPFGGGVGRVLLETYLDAAGRVPVELGARDRALGSPGERVVFAARVTGPAGGLAPAGVAPAPALGERGLPGAPPPPPGGPGQPRGAAGGPGGGPPGGQAGFQGRGQGPGAPSGAPPPPPPGFSPPPAAFPGGFSGARGAPPPSAGAPGGGGRR